MKLGGFVIILALCCTTGAVNAQSYEHASAGAGTTSCGNYLAKESVTTLHQIFVSWVQGFLSGMNMADYVTAKRPPVQLPDSDSITAYIDKYCRDNPLESPLQGAMQLYKELRSHVNR